VDLDGAERKMAHMSQYNYNGGWGWFDFLKAIPNTAGKLYNSVIADTWNSGVDTYNSLKRGGVKGYLNDLSNEVSGMANNIKESANAAYKYHTTTPIGQQLKDFWKYSTQPERLEDVLLFYVSTEAPGLFQGNKGNLLTIETKSSAATKTLTTRDAATGSVKKVIGATGEVGENYLKNLGGEAQKFFQTDLGARYVDQFVNGVANESKVGYTTLTKQIKMQIAKDAELLRNSATTGVRKVVWNFFESPITGMAGASKPLLDALKNAGIQTTLIRNP
jgi:hypothetical protein